MRSKVTDTGDDNQNAKIEGKLYPILQSLAGRYHPKNEAVCKIRVDYRPHSNNQYPDSVLSTFRCHADIYLLCHF